MEQIIYHTEINVLFFSKRQPLLHLEQEPWGKLYYRQKTLQCVHPVSAWTTNLHPFTIKNYAIENFVSIHYTHANGSWANSKAWALFKNSKNNICTQKNLISLSLCFMLIVNWIFPNSRSPVFRDLSQYLILKCQNDNLHRKLFKKIVWTQFGLN